MLHNYCRARNIPFEVAADVSASIAAEEGTAGTDNARQDNRVSNVTSEGAGDVVQDDIVQDDVVSGYKQGSVSSRHILHK